MPPISSVRPRPDGSFTIPVPESGFYSLVARAGGHLAMERFVRFVVEETETPQVELPPASPLEVRAVGPDGQPFAGVVIQAIPQQREEGDWRAAERRGVTDAQGKVVFPRAEGEALTLTITTPGLYSMAETAPSRGAQTVRFPAPRSRTIEIRGGNGKPAAGALVRLARRGWPFGLTGPDGRIALPVPDKGEIGFIAEDSKGLRLEVVMTVEAGEGTDVPVVTLRSPTTVTGVSDVLIPQQEPQVDLGEVRLLPGAAIEGIVTDARGRPVEGAWVRPNPFGPDGVVTAHVALSGRSPILTGPEGRFKIADLPRGALPAARVAVLQEQSPPRGGTTGHDGTFRIERIPLGSYRLVVALSTGIVHSQTIEISGDQEVTLEIALGTLSGYP